ncbi:hypothetical protein J6590_054940 [Homalodisca vitripennis]|nr:hypothetical protein J6590_054940 [Homalodisca vitripennis]
MVRKYDFGNQVFWNSLPFKEPESGRESCSKKPSSQGRGLPELVGSCSNRSVSVDGLVRAGADTKYVYSQATKSHSRPLILLAGTNDCVKKTPQFIYQKMEDFVKKTFGPLQQGSSDMTSKTDILSYVADHPINIIEAHMADVIKLHKHDKKVGFVHSISGDFNSPHQMTAGVAIVFRNHFWRPNISQCLTNHLALQENINGASVFSLITKDSYFGKPTKNLVERLKHLICTRSGTSSSPYCDGGVPLVNSNLMAAQAVMEEAEAIPSTTEMLPVADQLPTGSRVIKRV